MFYRYYDELHTLRVATIEDGLSTAYFLMCLSESRPGLYQVTVVVNGKSPMKSTLTYGFTSGASLSQPTRAVTR
jgi:hypothetical protein